MKIKKLTPLFLFIIFLAILACSTQKSLKNVEQVKEEKLPEVDTEYYAMVEKPAVFNNGDIKTFITFIKKSLKYPQAALKKKQQGTTVVQFGIDWNGKLNVFSVLKSSGVKTLDSEVLRCLKSSPVWQPAKNKSQSVGQLFMLQFKFNAKSKSVEIFI